MHSNSSQNSQSHGEHVFVLIEQYFPNEGKQEDILNIAKQSAQTIHGVQGLLQAKTLRPKVQSAPVCNITTWESEDDFKFFMKSDAMKDLLKSETMKNVKEWCLEVKAQTFEVESGWHQ